MTTLDERFQRAVEQFAAGTGLAIEDARDALCQLSNAMREIGGELADPNMWNNPPCTHRESRIGNTYKQYPTSKPAWARRRP